MMPKAKASYFCENCGAEVPGNSRFCPKCGKFFSSVRCPKCAHTGSAYSFRNGCPVCHYAMDGNTGTESDEPHESKKKTHLSLKSKKAIKKAFAPYAGAKSYDFGVPMWLFVSALFVLILIIGIIFYRCH